MKIPLRKRINKRSDGGASFISDCQGDHVLRLAKLG